MSNGAVGAAGYAGEASVSLQYPSPSGSEALSEAGPFSGRLALYLVSILPVCAAAAVLSIHTLTTRRSGERTGAQVAEATRGERAVRSQEGMGLLSW